VAELEGPQVALAILEDLSGDKRLQDYQPYWAAFADLLARTGQRERAGHAYGMAIGLTRDETARRFLQQRQAVIASAKGA
jgi:RNA polymerase sigma-70 factor (ECF subfamily)